MAGSNSSFNLVFLISLYFSVFFNCLAAENDPSSSWPGHLEPLGAQNQKISLETLHSFPEPMEFFQKYASKLRPVLIKGGARISPAFERWTDEYFLSIPEAKDHEVVTEQGKKENRSNPAKQTSFHEFVRTYKDQDVYMVHGVLPFLQKDVMLPPSLLCEEVTKNMLVDTVMWFSSGGTKSVLHNDDVDNMNCLFSGTKELLFIDYKYKGQVKIDHPVGGYSGVDVDRVDFTKYPGLRDVQYYNVTMETGDCLFIPYKWYHQVRSHDRNIAVNVWWQHIPNFVPKTCERPQPSGPYTLDKFYFSSLAKQGEEEEGPENLVEHFSSFLTPGDQGQITFKTFREKMKGDEVMMGRGKYKWNERFEEVARNVFAVMDVDKDGIFTETDSESLQGNDQATKDLENLAAEIEDLIEDQQEPLAEKEKSISQESEESSKDEL